MKPLEKRDIAIVLGTGAEDITKFGIEIEEEAPPGVSYSQNRCQKSGKARLYKAKINDVPVYLLSRHSSEVYTPAYSLDHDAHMYALVNDEYGAGARIILGSSLVGGCRTMPWVIGDKVAIVDCVDEHPGNQFFDGSDNYTHGHGLSDGSVTKILLRKARDIGIDVKDGGIYYTGPYTTRARFETRAEMAHLLLPAYVAQALIAQAKINGSYTGIAIQRLEQTLRNYPNLVGMTDAQEKGRARTVSTGRRDNYRTRFASFAVISDFPEDEETDHKKNKEIADRELPKIIEIFAASVGELKRFLDKEREENVSFLFYP